MKLLLIVLGTMSIILYSSISIYYLRKKNWLNPMFIVAVAHFISVGLYFVTLIFDFDILNSILYVDERLIFKYWIIKNIGFLALILGIKFGERIKTPVIYLDFKFSDFKCKKAFKYGVIISFLAYFSLMNKNGGILYFINHINQRVKFLSGNILEQKFMMFGIFSLISYMVYSKNKKIILYLYSILVLGMFITLGGRGPVIIYGLILMMVYNYNVSKINFINFRSILLSVLLVIFIIISPIFRNPQNMEEIKKGNYNVIMKELNFKIMGKVINEVSRQWIQIFIIKEYENRELELGATFLDIPKRIFRNREDRPPVDDGMYIWNSYLGKFFERGTPIKQMHASSWPPKTLGTSYINFGVIGVFLIMFFMGILYEKIYKLLKYTDYNGLYIYLYIYIMRSFTFSNLGLVNLVINMFFLLLFIIIFFRPIKIKLMKI